MKFNEWLAQNHGEEFTNQDLGMNTREEDGLVENQLEQWVVRLNGLLHALPPHRKTELLEKVIVSIEDIMKNG